MVLMGIFGELGAGKTLGLTYMAYRNLLKGQKIFSNYKLEFPFTPVHDIEELLNMREGFFAGDELWVWLDARCSSSKRNRAVSAILLKSRKRDIHICYTAQAFRQVDIRIRGITDFIAIPKLSPNEDFCRLTIFSNPALSVVKTYGFFTEKYFNLFDTKEEISPMEDL